MPRRVLIRDEPLVQKPDTSRCPKLLQICGCSDTDLDRILKCEDTIDYHGGPNVALFYLLMNKIEEAENLSLQLDFPRIIDQFGLPQPNRLASLCKWIRNCVQKAFEKDKLDLLLNVPAPLAPPPETYLGSYCKNAGITEDWLFSSESFQGDSHLITIGSILELLHLKENKNVSYTESAVWIQRLFNLDKPPLPGSTQRQWRRIADHASALRGKQKERASYLELPYCPPRPAKPVQAVAVLHSDFTQSKEIILVDQATQCSKQFPSLVELASLAVNKLSSNSVQVLDDLKNIEAKLQSEKLQLTILQDQVQAATSKLDCVGKKVGHYDTKNVYKRDKRAAVTRASLDDSLKQIKCLRAKVESLEKAKCSALKLKSKWKQKVLKSAKKCDKCDEKHEKISNLNDSVHELEYQLDCKSEMISDQMSTANSSAGDCSVKTQEIQDGHVRYTDDLRLVYMQLLSLGISVAKCSEVVQTVLNGLTDLDIEKLPTKSTTSNFQAECETLGQMHVANVMIENKDITVQLDGSKKRFREFGSFQISRSLGATCSSDTDASDGNAKPVEQTRETLSIGIQEMSKGDADSFVETLMIILGDLAETFTDEKEKIEEVKTKLIGNVKNLMTDRHVVNKLFKVKLEDARRELFQKHFTEFKDLSTERQDQLVELHGLYCGLHVLANMGTAAAKALKVFEEIALPPGTKISDSAFKKGNARTFDLIFELSQSMTISGSMRTGRYADWDAFMKDVGKTSRLVSFLRHRFNVLFTNGAGAYYHKEDIKEFLKRQKTNKMLDCITDSVNSPVCIAALRALGIFAVLVTQPLWRVVERQNIHVFQLNEHWLHLKTCLDEFSKDATDLLNGHTVFQGFEVQRDVVYEELFKPTTAEIQTLTKECLELISFHTLTLVERQLEDQLPGGKYSMPAADVLKATESCPTTNRSGEKDFSDLDRELKRAPQRSTSHISGSVCFRNNKSWAYFKQLPKEQRQQMMRRSIKLAPDRRIKNRIRRERVKETRKKEMHKRKEMAEEKKKKAEKRVNSIITSVQKLGGVWYNNEVVAEHLETISRESGKVQAMKDQILYQTVVRKKKFSERNISQFSSQGKKYTLEQLTVNYGKMLASGNCDIAIEPVVIESIQGHEIRQVEERRELIVAHQQVELQKDTYKVDVPKPSIKSHPKKSTAMSLTLAGKLLKSAKANLKNKKRKLPGAEEMPVSKKGKLDRPTSTTQLFVFTTDCVNTFIVTAYEDQWYLGQIIKVCDEENADVRYMKRVGGAYFKWPAKYKVETTHTKFLLQSGLTISPKGSSLRIWQFDGDTDQIDTKYRQYCLKYFGQ